MCFTVFSQFGAPNNRGNDRGNNRGDDRGDNRGDDRGDDRKTIVDDAKTIVFLDQGFVL